MKRRLCCRLCRRVFDESKRTKTCKGCGLRRLNDLIVDVLYLVRNKIKSIF